MTSACHRTLCRTRLAVGIYFANSSSVLSCEHSFPSQIVQKSRLSFPRILVRVGGLPSRVWVQVMCRDLYSTLPVVPLCIALSNSPSKEEGRVLVYPRKLLYRVVYAYLLTAPCRILILLSSCLRRGCAYYTWIYDSRGEILTWVFYAYSKSWFEKKASQLILNRKYWKMNWSAYKQI